MRREAAAPVLVGRLVRLEPLSLDHVPDLTRAAGEDRSPFAYTTVPDGTDEVVEYVRRRMASDNYMAFAQVRSDDGRAVGSTAFLEFRRRGDDGPLYALSIGGTWLAASAQRSGINQEAKLLLLTHAFEHWRVARVDFLTDARNERSRRAIERLGARFEGVLRNWQPSHAHGEGDMLRDTAVFSVVESDWPTVAEGLGRAVARPRPPVPDRFTAVAKGRPMSLRVVGAGLGRTGTHSLKIAFEQLLGGPCYHMLEVINRPDQAAVWADAARGSEPDWAGFLSGYSATVDWPAAAFWRELRAAAPEAVVVLSVRDSTAWWNSACETIFAVLARGAPPEDQGAVAELAMITDVLERRFTPDWRDRDAAIAAYEAHNEAVRASVDPERLVEWRPGDGWEPLCAALGFAVPSEPFPHVNTTSEFRAFTGLDPAP